jgi:hypothetical protein
MIVPDSHVMGRGMAAERPRAPPQSWSFGMESSALEEPRNVAPEISVVEAPESAAPAVEMPAEPTGDMPDELRATRPAQLTAGSSRKRTMVAAGIALGVIGVGGLSAGAYLMGSGKSRRAEIHMGPIGDLPEIKDGVVAVKTSAGDTPAPAKARSASASVLSPAPATPVRMVEPRTILPAPQAALAPPTGPVASFAPAPIAPSPTSLAPVAGPVAAAPVEPAPAAQPAAPVAAASEGQSAALPAEAPLPPRAPLRSVVQKAGPKPERTANVQRRQPARRVEASAASATTASTVSVESPPAEERTTVLGVPMPDLAQTGRTIKDGVVSFGEAVINLPSRF